MGFFQTWTTEVTGNNPHPERDPRWMFDKGNEASTSFLFFVAASLLTMTAQAASVPRPLALLQRFGKAVLCGKHRWRLRTEIS